MLTLTILAQITCFLFGIGSILACVAWTRRGGAVIGLSIVFLLGTVRQFLVLWEGVHAGSGAEQLREVAIFGIAIAALTVLQAIQRTTRERDRAEDLHWDSMEAVRVMSELAGRPGASLEDKIDTMLRLGMVRFRLDQGAVWQSDGTELGWTHLHPDRHADGAFSVTSDVIAALRDASASEKSSYRITETEAGHSLAIFAAPVRTGQVQRGAIGFFGKRIAKNRLAATENDLLGLMAHWLGTELERLDRANEQKVTAISATAASQARERQRDLNADVERSVARLRKLVGTDASLEINLAENVPVPRARRVSPPLLLASLVCAAARVAPTAKIRVSTGASAAPDAADLHATISVTATSHRVDATAFDRLYPKEDPADGSLPLDRIERLLQQDGGALSATVNAGVGITLVAFLPSIGVTSHDDTSPSLNTPPVH